MEIALAIEKALAPRQDSPPGAGAKTQGYSAGRPRQAATPRSGSSVLPGADRQAAAAARSGAVQPEAAEPSAAPLQPQRFPISTCLLRQEGGSWSMERRSLQVEGYREDLGGWVELTMVKIPAGSFLMGAPEDEPARSDEERPQH